MSKEALISDLTQAVQHNCHIADSLHAGDYTLCIYLLKMRELYRWEQGETYDAALPNRDVGNWLREREALWDDLDEEEFKHLHIHEDQHSPFESNQINDSLRDFGLVYSGGMGINNRPHFFLADLEKHEDYEGYQLFIAGKEHARDMSAPPAMSNQNSIYIRKESIKRLLWERLETWRWNRPDNALGRSFACYDLDNKLEQALDEMTETETINIIQHERGEIEAGKLLGEQWEELLFSLPHSKSALMLRGIRDNLADSLSTLPALLERDHAPSWHFYFGNLSNMRKDLNPSLMKAYNEWYESGSLGKMQSVISQARQHWLELCQSILEVDQGDFAKMQKTIECMVEDNRL